MESLRVDAVVIGAGPGGYVAGIRLGQLGKKALVVERDKAGGVCLNVGCIPSKALINAAKLYEKIAHASALGILVDNPRVDMAKLQSWKDGVVGKLSMGVRQLLKANGCDWRGGSARLLSPGRVEIQGSGSDVGKSYLVEAAHIVIASGARPVQIPGFAFDGNRVVDSTGALAFTEVPRRLVVIGAGYIGMEIGTLYAKLGSHVTFVEALPSILSGSEADCVQVVARKAKQLGMDILVDAKASAWSEKGDRAVVTVATKTGERQLDADKILVSVGRQPNSENLGLEAAGVRVERGFISVDRKMRTNVAGIYAIGDVVGQPQLAHKASREAEVVAEVIAGRAAEMDAQVIPSVVFTDPEIASAGLTAAEAEQKGLQITQGKFPLLALGRAIANHDTDGFVKVVIETQSRQVRGVHIVANGAGDLIAEAALAIEMGALAGDIAGTIHAHPTLPEAIMEAAKAALGEAIHIQNRR
ncbi:MAG: dihydrolipoyl dehydrogenase [Polyangia bacterium]